MKCSVEDCERIATRKGLCNAHYLRQWRHGDPEYGGIMRGSTHAFIRDNVAYSGDDCLVWPFYRISTGYGMVNYGGVRTLAHRVMCRIAHGDPPDESYEAAHNCGKGHEGCINPKHLEWKTTLQNSHDKEVHGTQPWGKDIHFAKLTLDQAREAKYGNESSSILAKRFGVSSNAINSIRSGRTWKKA